MRETNSSKIDIYRGRDPRDIPAYTYADAASYLNLPLSTLRSWIRGFMYETKSGKRLFKPVFHLPEPELPRLSYTNLVEAFVLGGLRRKYKVDLNKIRTAISILERDFGSH